MASLFAYHQKMSVKAYHEMPSRNVICNAILCLIINVKNMEEIDYYSFFNSELE